jgi:hypothetical protein
MSFLLLETEKVSTKMFNSIQINKIEDEETFDSFEYLAFCFNELFKLTAMNLGSDYSVITTNFHSLNAPIRNEVRSFKADS